MPEYLPLHLPDLAFTRQASGTILGGQLVAVSGSGTVAVAGAASLSVVGVAAFDVTVGQNVTVFCAGVQRPTASGAITAGDLLVSAANGQVSTAAAVTTPTAGDVTTSRAIVGLALTTAINGALVEVLMTR